MKKMLTFFILWMLVLAGILSMAGCSMRFRKVRIGTAGIGGNYYSFRSRRSILPSSRQIF